MTDYSPLKKMSEDLREETERIRRQINYRNKKQELLDKVYLIELEETIQDLYARTQHLQRELSHKLKPGEANAINAAIRALSKRAKVTERSKDLRQKLWQMRFENQLYQMTAYMLKVQKRMDNLVSKYAMAEVAINFIRPRNEPQYEVQIVVGRQYDVVNDVRAHHYSLEVGETDSAPRLFGSVATTNHDNISNFNFGLNWRVVYADRTSGFGFRPKAGFGLGLGRIGGLDGGTAKVDIGCELQFGAHLTLGASMGATALTNFDDSRTALHTGLVLGLKF